MLIASNNYIFKGNITEVYYILIISFVVADTFNVTFYDPREGPKVFQIHQMISHIITDPYQQNTHKSKNSAHMVKQ